MDKVLVISPHPDDEAIGCGGTIRKHIVEGDTVEVVFLTSGENGGHGRSKEETVRVREQEAESAARILGISKIDFWHQPDGAMQLTEALVSRLQEKIEIFNPNWIYVPHENEAHPDHQISVRLVIKALSQLNASTVKPAVRMYEVWTPIQKIDLIVDISEYVDVKRSSIQAYKSQCSVLKFDEAILGLNRYRGEMHSWPGGDYAEIFKEVVQ